MKFAMRLPVSLLAAALLAWPATPQQGNPVNPTRAAVKAGCQPQLDAATRIADFNAPRYGGMQMLDAYIDSAMYMSDRDVKQQLDTEQKRITAADYQQATYSAAMACFYIHILDYRASHATTKPSRTYYSVCERNREKIIETLRGRGLEAYAATYDLFNIDMNEKWIQLYQGCVAYDRTIKDYDDFTREIVAKARQHCAGPHNAQLECTQWGYGRPADNKRYYEAFVIEFNKAISDPNYSADLGSAKGPDGKVVQAGSAPLPAPKPVAQAPAPVAQAPAPIPKAAPPPAPVAVAKPATSAPAPAPTPQASPGPQTKLNTSLLDRALGGARGTGAGSGQNGDSSAARDGGAPVADRGAAEPAADKQPKQAIDPITPSGQALQMQAANSWSQRSDSVAANKKRKVHFGDNDATPCVRVDATGNKVEWGVEGRYRITNTCSYPVEVAWCANVRECNGPGGNLWTIGAGRGYPIFFSDEANPYIEISACRTGANAKPLPGPYGSFSEDHLPPHPASAPAVHVMTKHICGGG